jgi:hypothetical protein
MVMNISEIEKRVDRALGRHGHEPITTGIRKAIADVVAEVVAEERARCAELPEAMLKHLETHPHDRHVHKMTAADILSAIRNGA